MAKIGFVGAMLLLFLGILMLSGGLLIQALLPKIGYFIFQTGGHSYNPRDYELGFAMWMHHALAAACIAVGLCLSRRYYADR